MIATFDHHNIFIVQATAISSDRWTQTLELRMVRQVSFHQPTSTSFRCACKKRRVFVRYLNYIQQEPLLKVKGSVQLPPCHLLYIIQNIDFYTPSYLNEEVDSTEPLVSVPCIQLRNESNLVMMLLCFKQKTIQLYFRAAF